MNVDQGPGVFLLPGDLHTLVARVRAAMHRIAPRPAVILVAGGTSTGKSNFVAAPLVAALGSEVRLLSQDMHQLADSSRLDPRYMRDDPANYGLAECREALAQFQRGEPLSWPQFDFAAGTHGPRRCVAPGSALVLEGLYAAHASLAPLADHVVYAEAPAVVRLVRRMLRSRFERYSGRNLESRSGAHFLSTVAAAHRTHVVVQRAAAHAIVRTDLSFQVLRERFALTPLPTPQEQVLWRTQFDPRTVVTVERTLVHPRLLRVRQNWVCFLEVPLDEDVLLALQNFDPQAL